MFWITSGFGIGSIVNYGVMGGIDLGINSTLILDNRGTIKPIWQHKNEQRTHISLSNNAKVLIQNYALNINEDAMTFNKFSGSGDKNSHLVISGSGVSFKDAHSKIILGFGEKFEFGVGYAINKLATDTSGSAYSELGVDFSRIVPKNDIYTLTQSGQYFIAKLTPQYGIIGTLHKANVRTMNNFYLMSNAMIYPRKLYHLQNLGRTHSLLQYSPSLAEGARGWVEYPSLRDSALDSAFSLKSYKSFAYRNESQNRRIQRQNKRNYNRKSQNQTQNLKESQRNPQTQTFSRNLAQNPHDYYFILTPFINHNLFLESGRYNLSGFDYGFLTAFSARVAESNSLGAHFMMSYGSLGDKQDKDFMIKSLNLNLGLNYKLDLAWDMYLKARGDFYYFLNQAKTLTMIEAIKPNNMGFGLSVSYGKDFDFGKGGVLGIEVGIDYKALQSSTISLHDNIYQKALYHLLYADLGVSYSKYFGNFGLNAGLGIKGNITANKLAKSQIRISNLNRNVDMVLDNDNFLGYANFGVSYMLQAKNFDMEFSLTYYGNFGDKAISNAGGFEWRVLF